MPSGNTALHTAIRNFKGDIRSIKSFLDHNNSEINVRNSAGETPIHKAVQNEACTIELLQLLMEYGADIKATTSLEGNTALHLLTIRGEGGIFDQKQAVVDQPFAKWTKLAEFLMLQLGQDVNTGNFQNDTMLHFYLKNFKTSLSTHLKMLLYFFLKKNCDFNAVNLTGETPLHLIVRDEVLCDVFLIKLFIDLGADVSKRDRSGENVYEAYRRAVKRGTREDYRVNTVLQTELAQEDERQRYMDSSLHLACLYHNVDSVHKMLKLGVDVNGLDTLGHPPLYYAVKAVLPDELAVKDHNNYPKSSTARLLLDYGANFNHQIILDSGTPCTILMREIFYTSYPGYSAQRIFHDHLSKLFALRDKQIERGIDAVEILTEPDRAKLESLLPSRNFPARFTGGYKEFYIRNFAPSAREELKAMIETKIGESEVSFYDLMMVVSAKEMVMYAKNKELVRAFHAGKIAFPLYQGMLDAKFARHLERRRLIESVAVLMSEALEFADPSDEFYEGTLSYLSNEELNRLMIDGNV